jgi:hypothetical protein
MRRRHAFRTHALGSCQLPENRQFRQLSASAAYVVSANCNESALKVGAALAVKEMEDSETHDPSISIATPSSGCSADRHGLQKEGASTASTSATESGTAATCAKSACDPRVYRGTGHDRPRRVGGIAVGSK